MTNDLHVKLYHQKGHCTRRVMSVALNTFKSTNYIDEFITDKFMYFICDMNDYVDRTSRMVLNQKVSQSLDSDIQKIEDSVPFVYNPFNVKAYLKMVKN